MCWLYFLHVFAYCTQTKKVTQLNFVVWFSCITVKILFSIIFLQKIYKFILLNRICKLKIEKKISNLSFFRKKCAQKNHNKINLYNLFFVIFFLLDTKTSKDDFLYHLNIHDIMNKTPPTEAVDFVNAFMFYKSKISKETYQFHQGDQVDAVKIFKIWIFWI